MNDLIQALLRVEEECTSILIMAKFNSEENAEGIAAIRTSAILSLQKLINEKDAYLA